jgi:hypothetical protein
VTLKEFSAAIGFDGEELTAAFEVFQEELTAPRKTLAARTADLAAGLRLCGLDEDVVATAVTTLAMERRR